MKKTRKKKNACFCFQHYFFLSPFFFFLRFFFVVPRFGSTKKNFRKKSAHVIGGNEFTVLIKKETPVCVPIPCNSEIRFQISNKLACFPLVFRKQRVRRAFGKFPVWYFV